MREATLRAVVTPEGVPLHFQVAGVVDRYAAFAVDAVLIVGATLLLALVCALLGFFSAGGRWFLALFYLASFLLRHGYFIWFEIRRQGATPGKRRAGLRVVDRGGGSLTAEAVFARNLTREVEVFLPLVLLLEPRALLTEAPAWAALLGSGWILLLAALPFFNRDHLRIGDVVGGTLVVRAPTAVLLRDLSTAPASSKERPRYSFTPAQLSVYGVYELQVLEEILRAPRAEVRALEKIAARIRKKIRWSPSGGPVPARAFLQDFYDAQRAHLEGRLLMGERRERKGKGTGRG